MWGTVALAGLGALAGAQGDRQSSTSSVNLAPAGEAELAANRVVTGGLNSLEGMVNAGPGAGAQIAANASNAQLANLLQQFSQGGYLPTQADFATANQFAQSAFAPQQTAINQQFDEEKQRASQLAAQLGRPVNDPIIQAKLSQERMRAQERLGASQSAFTSEFALSQPQQRLGYTAQLADIQQGLASQAMANRQALIGLGSQIQGQQMNFRAGTASRTQSQSGGGGLAGAISGGLAGFGAGMSAFGGAGGGKSSPLAQGIGSAVGSYLSPGNLNADYGFSTPSAPVNFGSSSLGQLGSGYRSQLASYSSPSAESTYRGALSRNAPIYSLPFTNDFGAFGEMGSNGPGPLAPYRPNPYGSTYGITPR